MRTAPALARLAFVLLAAVVASLAAPPAAAQTAPDSGRRPAPPAVTNGGCDLCHGELELLRQRVSGLERARALLVPAATVAASAHDTLACSRCHTGFDRFPHPPTDAATPAGVRGATTTACASCHADEADLWTGSIHEREDEQADCTECHGVHDVLPTGALSEGPGRRRMNDACVACHDTSPLPAMDPHADTVGCWSCHGPHDTQATHAATSRVAPTAQLATCGACHEEVADSLPRDAHGQALRASGIEDLAGLEHEQPQAPPTCTTCHDAHGMVEPAAPGFGQAMVGRCSTCHEHWAETFDETYHGQATALGSEYVATCQDCHSAHDVRPASDPRSTVSEARLLETCRSCHPDATEGFASFQPHADHHDRERYPWVWWSYHLMTGLLIGVFAFFGAHTALWLFRLAKDGWSGQEHGGDST